MTSPNSRVSVHSINDADLDRFHSMGEPEADIRNNLRALWRDGLSDPAKCFFAVRADTPIGLAAYWAFPETPHEMFLTTLELPWRDHPGSVGRTLLVESTSVLKAGGAASIECKLYDSETFLDQRRAVLSAGAFEMVQEKIRFEAFPSSPRVSIRLAFRSRQEVGDDAFRDAIRRVTVGTLDSKDQASVETIGPEAAASEYFDLLRSIDDDGTRWKLAFDARGRLVGLIVAHHLSKDLGAINYIGVVPEARGRGYVDDLLAEGMCILGSLGLDKVLAEIDARNHPLARALARAGYQQLQRLWVYQLGLECLPT
jgi:RimJ/RimL family protein N-acetyltransferase